MEGDDSFKPGGDAVIAADACTTTSIRVGLRSGLLKWLIFIEGKTFGVRSVLSFSATRHRNTSMILPRKNFVH